MDMLELVHGTRAAEAGADSFVAFADWTPDALAALGGLGRLEDHRAGELVIEAGARGERDLFVIVSGQLEVFRQVGRQTHRIAQLGSGDMVGEMSFVDGGPRSASVRALSAARALRVSPADLDALCQRSPTIALDFMREIARILSFRLRTASP